VPSQFNEDLILQNLFCDRGGGTYLDVGGGPPIVSSNTFSLYEKGWNGLVIEPQSEYAKQYKEIRPRDIVLTIAASNKSGKTTLYDHSMWATLEKPSKRRFSELVENPVDAYTLNDILDNFPAIRDNCQLCDIDVEHHEKCVIEGIDISKFRPEVFLVEAFEYKQWENILLDNGYKYYMASSPVPVNRFYLREDL